MNHAVCIAEFARKKIKEEGTQEPRTWKDRTDEAQIEEQNRSAKTKREIEGRSRGWEKDAWCTSVCVSSCFLSSLSTQGLLKGWMLC